MGSLKLAFVFVALLSSAVVRWFVAIACIGWFVSEFVLFKFRSLYDVGVTESIQ